MLELTTSYYITPLKIDSTTFTNLFKGESQHLPHYLQNYLRERANIYRIIYVEESILTVCK
jgi:hypothetical protein